MRTRSWTWGWRRTAISKCSGPRSMTRSRRRWARCIARRARAARYPECARTTAACRCAAVVRNISARSRSMALLVANVYPTYTYADDPSRSVAAKEAQQSFRDAVDRYACRLYSLLERAAEYPWFLGPRVSALDL